MFILMTLESASVPIPSEVVLPFAGYLVFIGVMDFYLVVLVSTAAGVVGALVDYYLAYFLGRPFVAVLLKAFGLRASSLERAESWFGRSGQWTVFAARFVPVLRSVISLPAGLFRMKLTYFVLMTAIGCLGWSAILVYAGYLAGGSLSTVVASSSILLVDIVSVGAGVASLSYLAYYVYGSGRVAGEDLSSGV